jgi:hypothetical protein
MDGHGDGIAERKSRFLGEAVGVTGPPRRAGYRAEVTDTIAMSAHRTSPSFLITMGILGSSWLG